MYLCVLLYFKEKLLYYSSKPDWNNKFYCLWVQRDGTRLKCSNSAVSLQAVHIFHYDFSSPWGFNSLSQIKSETLTLSNILCMLRINCSHILISTSFLIFFSQLTIIVLSYCLLKFIVLIFFWLANIFLVAPNTHSVGAKEGE